MRLLQLWARLFVVSMLAGAVAHAFTRNGARLWLGTASTATIAVVGAIGGLVVIVSVVRVRSITRRLSRAVAARTDTAVDTPYLAMERAFAPLVESRAVRDLS